MARHGQAGFSRPELAGAVHISRGKKTFPSHGRFLQLSWAHAGGCPQKTPGSPFAIPQSHRIDVSEGFS